MENKPEILFKNRTKNTVDSYAEFLNFHHKAFHASYVAYTVFWSFMFFLCIILCFGSNARTQGVLFSIVLIVFIIYRILRPKMLVDNELKGDKLTTNNINTFYFYDKTFEAKNERGVFSYKYSLLYKTFETDRYFYLYVNKENAFLVSRSAFSLGTPETFSSFMKKKCGLKYKKKTK